MKNKELIAFDLYGTCIHYPNNVKGFREILSSGILGDTINNLRNILLTRPINIEDAGFDMPDQLVNKINNYTQNNINSTVLYPDTISTLKYLKEKGYKLALISNLSKSYEIPFRELIPDSIFDYEALSFKVGEVKPNPGIFNHIIEESGVSPEKMVMVGDKFDIDIKGAQNVGIDGIRVNRNRPGIHDARDYIRISTLSELEKIF